MSELTTDQAAAVVAEQEAEKPEQLLARLLQEGLAAAQAKLDGLIEQLRADGFDLNVIQTSVNGAPVAMELRVVRRK